MGNPLDENIIPHYGLGVQPFCGVWVRFLMCLLCSRITSQHPPPASAPRQPVVSTPHLIGDAYTGKPPLAGLPLEGVSCAGLVSDVYEVDTLTYSILGNYEG